MSANLKPDSKGHHFTAADIKELNRAFPPINPNCVPFGSRVLVQVRKPKNKSEGGIILHAETLETEKWNTQVGLVMALGPVAFRNRETLAPWPEGPWAEPGEFVRIPKYGGDRFEVPIPGSDGEYALFVQFNDLDLGGRVPNPLETLAYI